jgi:hypothetical protein
MARTKGEQPAPSNTFAFPEFVGRVSAALASIFLADSNDRCLYEFLMFCL